MKNIVLAITLTLGMTSAFAQEVPHLPSKVTTVLTEEVVSIPVNIDYEHVHKVSPSYHYTSD